MIPGTVVLIDDRCCSKCDAETYTRGDRGTVREIARSGELLIEVERTSAVVWFRPVELLPIPAAAATEPYRCCSHCDCAFGTAGHSQPCTGCRQTLVDDADRDVARAMAAGR